MQWEQFFDYINTKDDVYSYKYEDKEPFDISLLENIKDRDFAKTMLAAALDRNIMVFDTDAENNHLTNDLFRLMQKIQIENTNRRIDFFFYPENFYNINMGYEFIPISIEEYYYLKDYYLNSLEGSFARGDKNFILGLSIKKGTMVSPQFENKKGICIMDNTVLLLGSF